MVGSIKFIKLSLYFKSEFIFKIKRKKYLYAEHINILSDYLYNKLFLHIKKIYLKRINE